MGSETIIPYSGAFAWQPAPTGSVNLFGAPTIGPLAPATYDPVSGLSSRQVSAIQGGSTLLPTSTTLLQQGTLTRLPGTVLSADGRTLDPVALAGVSGGVQASIPGGQVLSGGVGAGVLLPAPEPAPATDVDWATVNLWDRAATFYVTTQDTLSTLTTPGPDQGINWDLVARISGDVVRTVDSLIPALAPTVEGYGIYQGMQKRDIYNGLISLKEFAHSAMRAAGVEPPAGGVDWWWVLLAAALFYALD